MQYKDMVIARDDVICSITFWCNNKNAMHLLDLIDCEEESVFNKDDANCPFRVAFYRYIGVERNVKELANDNINNVSWLFTEKQYMLEMDPKEISNSVKRKYVFDIIYRPNKEAKNFEEQCDAINFMYLQIANIYLERKHFEHIFLISDRNENGTYKAMEDDYYRIREFLFYISPDFNNRLYALKSSKGSSDQWQRFFTDENLGNVKFFGKILPVFEISKETYLILSGIVNLNSGDIFYKLLHHYIDKSNELLKKYEIDIDLLKCCSTDNYFEKLIFISTLNYILLDKKITPGQILLLREKCIDYAQGILQIVENAYIHVVKDGEKGYGNLAIRIRKFDEVVSLKRKDEKTAVNSEKVKDKTKEDKDIEYYMEIYVTDFSFDKNDFRGIVDKFYDNLKNRWENEHNDYIKEIIESKEKIKLEDMFDAKPSNSYLLKYLEKPENVAHHYGLQIMDNVVMTGNGCLYVRSGSEDGFYMSKGQSNYIVQDIPWKKGTDYVLYLPIDTHERIDYSDSIVVKNEEYLPEISDNIKYVDVIINEIMKRGSIGAINKDGFNKEQFIGEIFKEVAKEKYGINDIVVIDCLNVKYIYYFEVIAKLVFLALTNNIYHNVALINILNRDEVIKMFRQFALFYNRSGHNHMMKDKSVFIVDINAECNVLLQGENLSSIKENMVINKVFGGIDDITFNIIDHILERQKNDKSKKVIL